MTYTFKEYGIFTNGTKVFCFKNATGEYDLPLTVKYSADPLELFDKVISGDYQCDKGVFGYSNMEFYVSAQQNLTIKTGAEICWVDKDSLAEINWSPDVRPIIEILKDMFINRYYRITEKNPDGTEEEMWADTCSSFQWQRVFSRLIDEQGEVYHAPGNTKPWRQIRAYNESGELIRTES
jgi:hypothetical protein